MWDNDIESKIENQESQIESFTEEQNETLSREQLLKNTIGKLEGDVQIQAALEKNIEETEKDKESLEQERKEFQDEIFSLQVQIDQMLESVQNEEDVLSELEKLGECVEDGKNQLENKKIFLKECYERLNNLRMLLDMETESLKIGDENKNTESGESSVSTQENKPSEWERIGDNKLKNIPFTKKMRERIVLENDRIQAVFNDVLQGSGKRITYQQADLIQKSVYNYTDMAGQIRSAYFDTDSPYRGQMEAIDAYIHNVPKWKGLVMRGVNVTKEILNQWFSEGSVDMLGPSSWSTDEGTAQKFARDKGLHTGPRENVVFVLPDNQSGAPVTHLSFYGISEHEVLAPSGVVYGIDHYEKIHEHFQDYVYIYVHEK